MRTLTVSTSRAWFALEQRRCQRAPQGRAELSGMRKRERRPGRLVTQYTHPTYIFTSNGARGTTKNSRTLYP